MKRAIPTSSIKRHLLALLLVSILALAGCGAAGEAGPSGKNGDGERAPGIGLYTSLPILWGESEDIGGFLGDGQPEHWAVGVLRSSGSLVPLDSLADGEGALRLKRGDVLILAQPRPLSPVENVALDDWVNSGGRVLLFADPMLTGHSIFALGDARRPQDVAMLSPILARWGLVLEFDEAQRPGERAVNLSEGAVPANLHGRFRPAKEASNGRCAFEAEGFLADCKVGGGRVVAVADAALFEQPRDREDAEARGAVLGQLIRRASQGM